MLKKIPHYVRKGIEYLRENGPAALIRKILSKLLKRELPIDYHVWLKKYLPDKKELSAQRMECFSYSPKISIIIPLKETSEKYLKGVLQKVSFQTYVNWELFFSDGSGLNSPYKNLLDKLQGSDSRVHVLHHDTQLHIAENINCAVKMTTGEFVAVLQPEDVLEPHALYECVKLLNEQAQLDLIYSDEDKMSMSGKKFFQPHLKPDFNPDLLRTVNYIGHFVLFRKNLIDQVGLFDSKYGGAWEYDYILRCVDTSKQIGHIPKILYHQRAGEEPKFTDIEAGKHAVNEHYRRNNLPAKADHGEYPGLYRTRYDWEEKPLISIIIPNKDHADDLNRCIRSIETKSKYPNLEYIIVENNSTEEKTFQFYKDLEAKNPRAHVVYWDDVFNYSAINNYGVQYAKGDYYLFLNNDTEIINDDCLEELLGYCMREDVGAVGARLYYEDDTIQHAGVVIGFGGIAGHCFVHQDRTDTGYCHRIISAQDYSAVTAACMMVKRSVFEEVGGLSAELAVAFNDIDFCMKIREAGYLIVYNPYAELYHYESKSRGLEDTPEKVARFNREIATFRKHWPEILEKGDPFYNPNLSLESQGFALKS